MNQRERVAQIFNREMAQAENDIEPHVEWIKGLRDEVLTVVDGAKVSAAWSGSTPSDAELEGVFSSRSAAAKYGDVEELTLDDPGWTPSTSV